jgi:signal peptidase I
MFGRGKRQLIRQQLGRWLRPASALAALVLVTVLAGCGGGKHEQTITLTVPSSSMEPTLHCARPAPGCEGNAADELIVEPGSQVERGDIIAFTTPPKAELVCGAGGTFVKRLIGLPGEKVQERSGWFYINGKRLDDSSYIKAGRRDDRTGVWFVPKNSYFFVGDNRTQSCDSRRWGSVAKRDIKGKVVAIQRPSGRIDLT